MIILLTIIAAILRFPLLSRPMGSDESATFIYYASHPLSIAVTIYGSPNNHILHTVLMHLSYRMLGPRRMGAAAAGISRRGGNRSADLRGCAFARKSRSAARGSSLSAAPVLIDYLTDPRGYTLLCCFVLICTAAMAEIIRSGSRRASWIFAVSAALGFYTVPVMLYPFVMLVVWGRRKALTAAAVAILIAVALYIPVLLISGIGSIASNPYVQPLPIAEFFRSVLPYLAAVRAHMLIGIPVIVQILLAIGLVIAVRRQPMWIGFLPVIILVGLQRVLPFPRVWLPFVVLMFITAAAAWPWSRTEPAVAAAVVVALAISGFTTERVRETGELRAVREITRELNRRAQKGDPVLATPPSEMPIAFYCSRVEVLNPDLSRTRLFVIENRDYGQTLPRTLAFFRIDPRRYAIRRVRDFGSSALYELRRGERASRPQ